MAIPLFHGVKGKVNKDDKIVTEKTNVELIITVQIFMDYEYKVFNNSYCHYSRDNGDWTNFSA